MIRKTYDINELASKPEWSEVVKLYSGLFDAEGDRFQFISSLIYSDLYLAAGCKTNSIREEQELKASILNRAKEIKTESSKIDKVVGKLLTLIELNEINLISYELSIINRPQPKKHKPLIERIIQDINNDQAKRFLIVLSHQNPSLFSWGLKAMNKDNILLDRQFLNKVTFEFIENNKIGSKTFIKFINEYGPLNSDIKDLLNECCKKNITQNKFGFRERTKLRNHIMLYLSLNEEYTDDDIFDQFSKNVKLKEIQKSRVRLAALLNNGTNE